MWNSHVMLGDDDAEDPVARFRRAVPPDDASPVTAPLPADSWFARTRQRGDR